MVDLLRGLAADRPGEMALTDECGGVSWAELDQRVDRCVHVLRSAGLCAGDTVCLMAGNRRETVEVLVACLHTGITVVPVNWHFTADEIAYLLVDSGSRGVITDPEYAAAAAAAATAAAPGASSLVRLVLGDEPVAGAVPVEPALAAAAAHAPAGQCSGALMLYTSGTTGRPKGVVNGMFRAGAPLSRVTRMLASLHARLGVPVQGRMLLVAPWYHSAQLYLSIFPLLAGCRLLVRRRFDPVELLALVDREQVTVCHLVPTHFVRLLRLDEPTRGAFRGDSLERVWHGGGACSVAVKRRMIEWWGPIFTEYYGATEGGIATLIGSTEWLRKPGSVGRPVPPTEIVVVGADGSALPPGQAGRIYLRRTADRDFRYHNAPEKTLAAHLGPGPGTFTYGELGRLDDDGYLFLTGRVADTIVTGGVNVYPAEVEAVLLDHPAVLDVAVLGLPDEEYGQRVGALVEIDPAARVDRNGVGVTLDQFCRQRLAGFKVPRSYEVVAAIPRDGTGKLRRHRLVPTAVTQPGPDPPVPAADRP